MDRAISSQFVYRGELRSPKKRFAGCVFTSVIFLKSVTSGNLPTLPSHFSQPTDTCSGHVLHGFQVHISNNFEFLLGPHLFLQKELVMNPIPGLRPEPADDGPGRATSG
ncbi:hypothetical protein ACJZ2D_007955 [Fusarium nematophilum]